MCFFCPLVILTGMRSSKESFGRFLISHRNLKTEVQNDKSNITPFSNIEDVVQRIDLWGPALVSCSDCVRLEEIESDVSVIGITIVHKLNKRQA